MAMAQDASELGQPCIVDMEEIMDKEVHFKSGSNIVFDEHRNPNKPLTAPVRDGKRELLVELVPSVICIKKEELSVHANINTNTFAFDEVDKSFVVNNKCEFVQGMASVQKKSNHNIQCTVCGMHQEEEMQFEGYLCESRNTDSYSRKYSNASKCEDISDASENKTTSNIQTSSTRERTPNSNTKKSKCDGELKSKDINADCNGKLTCELDKLDDTVIKLQDGERNDSLIEHADIHSHCENKYKLLGPYFKNNVDTVCQNVGMEYLDGKLQNVEYTFCQNCNVLHLKNNLSPSHSFNCNIGNKVFPTSKKPNSIHTEEEVFTCDICSKRFCQTFAFIYHMRVHSIKMPFTCEICRSTLSTFKRLLIHKKKHDSQKPFTSSICTRSMTARAKGKYFTCDICNKSCATKRLLENHKGQHFEY